MKLTVIIKGEEYRIYKVFYNGNCVYAFWAKSERAAKIKTSKFCGNDARLYKVMFGIKLCDEYEKEIATYSPFFSQWRNVSNI